MPKINVRNCVDLDNAQKKKMGRLTNSVDPDKTPQNAASHQGQRYFPCHTFLVTVDDIKYFMNQDLSLI